MKNTGCIFFVLVCLIGMAVLAFIGLSYSSFLDRRYKEIVDKNGLIVTAYVTGKQSGSRAKIISFKYEYKGKRFENTQRSDKLYKELQAGDIIRAMIDTLRPADSYVVEE